MKPRDLFILLLALCLLAALVGAAILVYLTNRAAAPLPGAATITLISDSTTHAPTATDTRPVPPLITPTPTGTATTTPTATPTSTPTLIPTPTFTPSPTIEPAMRLAGALRAKRNGNYQRALSELEAVLKSSGTEDEIREAQYQIGLCAYLDGDYTKAADVLLKFTQDYPDDHRTIAAHFYLAQAFEGLAQIEPAIEQYHAYLSGQDVLADLVYRRIGNNNTSLGQYEAAVEAYKSALDKTADLGQQYDLREQIGLIHSAWGRYDDAITWFQGILGQSENVYRRARLWYLIGQTYRLQGKEPEARDAFAQAVNDDPRPGYAHLALVELVNAGVPVNEYQRGLIDYYAGSYDAAVGAFYRYMESTPGYDSDAHYYVAQSYFNAGSFALAIQECERMTTSFPITATHWGDMWLLKGQALYSLERTDDALEAYLGFASAHTDHPLAAQARWKAAWMLERQDRYQEAARVYNELADQHPNDENAPSAHFRAGVCHYRSGDWDAALLDWRALVDAYPGSTDTLRGRYWLGKVLWAKGEVEQARVLLQKLAVEQPRDYYGLRAARLLAESKPSLWRNSPINPHLTSDEEQEQVEVAGWLKVWAGLSEGADPSAISPQLADDIRFRRGMEMLSLELRDQARDEFDILRKDQAQAPLQLYQLAVWTRNIGLYSVSIRSTIDLITLAPEVSVLDMPRLIQRLAFPTYFDDLVLAESASYNINPLLMFALIRQESVFDDQVISWAGAVGLTQIMPSTGQWIADALPWPEYTEQSLKRPYVNARFGAWFLNRILDQTQGEVMSALAGYNGGPANGVYWLEKSQGDPDLLVEIINYDEPQRYVREIYRHYDVYVRLYGKGEN